MSYASQQWNVCDNQTLANFKGWAQAISNAFSSGGWAQTSDTGQVNWSTIASVPAAGTFVYEVWHPTDPLQTGLSVFFVKILYGTSGGSPVGPRIQFAVCAGTDGAGNINTQLPNTGVIELGPTGIVGGGALITYDCYFSVDIDRFGMMLWRSNQSLNNSIFPLILCIERTHNTDGTNTTDGVCVMEGAGNNVGNIYQQMLVFGGPGYYNQVGGHNYSAIYDYVAAARSYFTHIPITPTFPIHGQVGNALTMIGIVHSQDIAESCFFNTTLYGAVRKYVCTHLISCGTPNSAGICMRFD